MKMKNGFTLVELLAVIVILAIILAIAIPGISGIIKTTAKNAFVSDAKMVLKQLEYKTLENSSFDTTVINENNVTDLKLSNANYEDLVVGIIDSKDYIIIVGKNRFDDLKVCGTRTDMVVVDATDTTTCETIVATNYSVSKGVNRPMLADGMTPVKWSGTTLVQTTETDPDWYTYASGNQKWANAMTADGSFWVWIPRYAYQIASGYHSNIAGTVNVKFLRDTTNTTSNSSTVATTPTYSGESQTNYIVHPAFTFGTTPVTGIWVAKFEASGTISQSQIDFKPNAIQLYNVSVGDIFSAVRNMEKTDRYGWDQEDGTLNADGTFTTNSNNVDTHMMKNIEWGAVAYLSKSVYGIKSEIFTNPSISYVTGRGGETVSQDGTTDTSDTASPTLYGYDGKSCLTKIGNVCTGATHEIYGTASSTTGTIYGIYGISSQGIYEYVMGNFNNTAGSSGLTPGSIDDKYIDRYTGYNNTVFGDAVWETSSSDSAPYENSWYNDYSDMVYASRPWFWRGGGFGTKAGAFFFYTFNGSANVGNFRATIIVGSGL